MLSIKDQQISIFKNQLPFGLAKACALTFSKFWDGARNLYEVVRDSWIFQENFFCPKNWEIQPKMGKKQAFLIYWKIYSLIFTEFDL